MPNYTKTSVLIEDMKYFQSPSEFFANFKTAWKSVSEKVYKLETRQVYREPGNPSFEELDKGNYEKAIELLEASRSGDIQLYKSLRERKVAFYRCRPVCMPMSEYLKWEMECYKFNMKHGEIIYISESNEIFEKYALHDFMVFDSTLAFVHDYDGNGEIQGGWVSENKAIITELSNLFEDVKANSALLNQAIK